MRYSYSYSAGDAAQQAETAALKKGKNGVPKKGDTAVANDESRESGTLVVHVAAVQAEYGNAFIGHELAHVVRTPAVRAMQALA